MKKLFAVQLVLLLSFLPFCLGCRAFGGDPPVITITGDLENQDKVVRAGQITGTLILTAKLSTSGKLTYQWYQAQNANLSDASRVGTNNSRLNIPTTLTVGTYYFYCEISAEGAVSVTSQKATVIVSEGEATAFITITKDIENQDKTGVYGEVSGTFTVAATVSPSGALTYAWYQAQSIDLSDEKKVGTNSTSFSIPSNLALGIYYFYCKISAPGAVTVSSKKAKVTIDEGEPPDQLDPVQTMTVTPTAILTDSGTVVNNPGKGWTPYVLPGRENIIKNRSGGLSADVLELGTVGYSRFDWKAIQSNTAAYDSFNWKIVDDARDAWKSVGKQFAFRIMAANSHGGAGETGKYITPKWVFENNPWGNSNYYIVEFENDGFNGDPGQKVLPIWNDPGFVAAVEHLAKALAERYGKDPDIAFIDIGTYGNWGEQHLYPFDQYESGKNKELTRAELTTHLKLYYDAFKAVNAKTRLAIDFGHDNYTPVYDNAIDNWGMSFRRDGVLGWEPAGQCQGEELVMAYGKVPAISESYATWTQYVQWGTSNGNLWTETKFWDSLYKSRVSYQSVQWDLDANAMYTAYPALMKKAANLLGFHFVLAKAVAPKQMNPGRDYYVEMEWQNHGLAPIYDPAKVAFALLSKTGNSVITLVEAENTDVKTWMPGRTIYENAKIRIPANSAKGTYRLAVGIFGDTVSGNPKYNIAIQGRIADNFRWYPLGDVTVTNTVSGMTAPASKPYSVFNGTLATTPSWSGKPVNPPDYPPSTPALNMGFENGLTGWTNWANATVLSDGDSKMGGNYVKLPPGRATNGWGTLARPLKAYFDANGAGRYRFGCWAKVKNPSDVHYANLGYRLVDVWPTFSPAWVQVGTTWTQIKTSDSGVTINPETTDANAVLAYISYVDSARTTFYTGEVYLDGFYFEFLGP
jgi:hypothetical protein